MKLKDILGSPISFLDQIFQNLENAGVDVSNYQLDHICYRVETEADYQEKKAILSGLGQILTETEINGRPIATIKLDNPIIYKNRKIYLIELPSPKSGNIYPEGFEHVEFVVDKPLEEFKKQYSHLDFDTNGFSKLVNRDLRLGFQGMSVKFHEHDLEYVIKYLD